MIISVIVPCRNEKSHISRVMDALLSQQLEPDCSMEVLVADGMSNDGTRELLKEYADRFSYIRVIDNPGRIVSTGLNAAIQNAAGEIIVRIDAHTTYARDYVRECVKTLELTGADNVGGPWIARGDGVLGHAIAAAFRSPFCTGGGKAHDPDYEGKVDTVYLGCWRRSVFDRVGLFDPDLTRNQDDEHNFRLIRSGGLIWQSPRIRSVYVPRHTYTALFKQYLQYGFWKVAVIRKHRSLASWRHVVPALFVGSSILILSLLLFTVLFGGVRVASKLAIILGSELSLYALLSITWAVVSIRSVDVRALLLLPGVFATYHVAYGIGFLLGLVSYRPRDPLRNDDRRLFTGLTR